MAPRLSILPMLALFASLLLSAASAANFEPPKETPIGGEQVQFDTEDGVRLHGNLFKPEGKTVRGAIVFVHQPFRTSRDWAYMAEKMSKQGFATIVFNLRGHGDSLMQGDEELDREMFGPEEYIAMVGDIAAAAKRIREVPGVPQDKVHLAGADLGASVALLYALQDPGVATLAMLSPGLGYDEVNIVGKVRAFGKRPLVLVYSVEDGYARKSTEVMAKEASGPLHVQQYYGVGHGAQMLAREPGLEDLMVGWFLGTIIQTSAAAIAESGRLDSGAKGVEGSAVDKDAQRRKLEEQKRNAAETQKNAVGEESEKGKRLGGR